MGELISQIKKLLPGNKFTPPRLDPTRQVVRESLIQEVTQGRWAKRRHLVLEAQAGQGKTTLAIQLLNKFDAPFVWYQVGPEDLDPVFFLSAIYFLFHESFPGFSAPQLEERILQGAIAASEVPFLAAQLIDGVKRSAGSDFFLAFDDLHHLEGSEGSCGLVTELVKNAPENFRFFLITRRKVPLLSESLQNDSQVLSLLNAQISFTKRETFALCNEIFGIPLSPAEVANVHEVTEGWVSGVLLWARSGDLREISHGKSLKSPKDYSEFFLYFIHNFMEDFPPETRTLMFQLAQLVEIPTGLADYLSDGVSIAAILDTLVQQNSFVRFYSTEGLDGSYRFHNLFREALSGVAPQEIDKAEQKRFLRKVAGWYLEQELPLSGLQYLLAAEDFEMTQLIMRDLGFQFISQNLHVTLKNLFEGSPEPEFRQWPWLSLIYGIVLMEVEPQKAFSLLKTANECLARAGDDLGELYSLIQLITYHVAVDARYGAGSQLLPRAEELFLALFDDLDLFARLQITPIVGLGYCLFDCNLPTARKYAELPTAFGGAAWMARFVAANCTLRSYIHFFAGNTRACLQEIEKSLDLLASPMVNPFFKMYLWLFQLNYLSMSGDFSNYEAQKELLFKVCRNEHISSTLIGSVILLWDMDQALAEGRYDDALKLVEHAQGKDFAAASNHLRSQYLHYGAYLFALKGDKEKALVWAERSAALRENAGGRYYRILNWMFLGATYALLGEKDKAERFLSDAVEDFRKTENEWMLPGALAHRAYFRLTSGRKDEALEDLSQALRYLRDKNYKHFYGWDPKIMVTLLGAGINANIEADFCRELARERLGMMFTEKEEAFPCLSIRVLGPTEIFVSEGFPLTAPQFTETQRRLMALLITAPGKQLSQEIIQELLWPEIDPEKGRKRFDTNLFRLRKTIAGLLEETPSHNFIQLQSGILYLKNCWIDMDVFKYQAQKGLKHFQLAEYWQANNAFCSAYSLWRGRFMANTSLEEGEESYRRELLGIFQDICVKWTGLLCRNGLCEEAAEVSEKALKEDATYEPLVRVLFNCHVQHRNSVQAGQVLKRYEEALLKQEYLAEDIDEILESFWK
jgi:LuxR family transcriptional regulator, maltose regulon positive regulatory protein